MSKAELAELKAQLRALRGGTFRPKAYEVLSRAVEEGVDAGWRHAWKHRTKEPPPDVATPVKVQIVQDIMNEICSYFDFD